MTTTDNYTLDPPGYASRVHELEREGLTTSDAQAIADAEFDAYDWTPTVTPPLPPGDRL